MHKSSTELRWQGLTHPFTWVVVAVLVVNDLLLKPHFPSWISGKLSDLALVYLISLLAYILLHECFPSRSSGLSILTGSLPAFLLFGVGKIFPPVNEWVVNLQQRLLPFDSHFLLDPSDALALLMIIPAIIVWLRSRNAPPVRAWRIVVLPLMMVAVLGDAAAPQYGIGCLQTLDDGSIVAYSPYQYTAYFSRDGGFSWDENDQQELIFKECSIPYHLADEVINYPLQDGHVLRFELNQNIQESADGGQTWKLVYDLQPPSQAKISFLKRKLSSYEILSGPLAVLEDSRHGTVVAAMGVEGVLLRTQNGGWEAIQVGKYAPFDDPKLRGTDDFFSLIWVELLLSLLGGVFLVSLYSLRWTKKWWRIGKVIAAWLGWSLIMVMSPALADSYLWGAIVGFGVPVTIVWAIFCVLDDLLSWRKKKEIPRRRIWLSAATAALLGMLPFVLWAADFIHSYTVAQVIVFGLALIFGIVGTIWSGNAPSMEEINDKP